MDLKLIKEELEKIKNQNPNGYRQEKLSYDVKQIMASLQIPLKLLTLNFTTQD